MSAYTRTGVVGRPSLGTADKGLLLLRAFDKSLPGPHRHDHGLVPAESCRSAAQTSSWRIDPVHLLEALHASRISRYRNRIWRPPRTGRSRCSKEPVTSISADIPGRPV